MTLGASGAASSVRKTRFLVVAAILTGGALAALPFRQPARIGVQMAASTVADITIRRKDVTALVSPHEEFSPAIGLGHASTPVVELSGPVPAGPDLDGLGPPPELPTRFMPVSRREPVAPWRPDPPPKEAVWRKHRLVDGDNLEALAERYLGSRERAREIFEANQSVLPARDLLPIGKTIRIPPAESPGDLEPAQQRLLP